MSINIINYVLRWLFIRVLILYSMIHFFSSMLCMIETQDITLFCEDFGPKLTDIGEVTKCSPKKFTLFPIFCLYRCLLWSQTIAMFAFRQLYCLVTSSVTYEQLFFSSYNVDVFIFSEYMKQHRKKSWNVSNVDKPTEKKD